MSALSQDSYLNEMNALFVSAAPKEGRDANGNLILGTAFLNGNLELQGQLISNSAPPVDPNPPPGPPPAPIPNPQPEANFWSCNLITLRTNQVSVMGNIQKRGFVTFTITSNSNLGSGAGPFAYFAFIITNNPQNTGLRYIQVTNVCDVSLALTVTGSDTNTITFNLTNAHAPDDGMVLSLLTTEQYQYNQPPPPGPP